MAKDLVFDIDVLKKAGKQYSKNAESLRNMAKTLDNLLGRLTESGWTTPAGKAFQDMTQIKWKENIDKYANLLDTLHEMLDEAAEKYESLLEDEVRNTRVGFNE